MKNKTKTVAEQIEALRRSIAKFGDSDGTRAKRLAQLCGETGKKEKK